MKKSIAYLGMALVLITNVSKASNRIGNQNKLKQLVSITDGTVLSRVNIQNLNYLNSDSIITEVIEKFSSNKKEKTADQLISEDNAITESNISNEKMALDFKVINHPTTNEDVIETVNFSNKEKTADELIAEDNAITDNTISNEAQPLDFNIINKKLIHTIDNGKSAVVQY
jgi:hypothetical protein